MTTHDTTPSHVRILARGLVVALVVGLLSLVSLTAAEAADDPCGPSGNAITCENSKPGSPASEWDVDGSGSSTIQGFATDISVDAGSTEKFKIDTDASAYSVTIYRIGYYGGTGARRIATVTPSASLPQKQPQCINDTTTQLVDCGNWGVSASWDVPANAVSGVYIALLKRADTGAASHITFVVRDDSSHSDLVFQTSDPTWQAYNTYGGSNFYSGGANGRAYKLSYNRPVLTRDGTGGRDFFFSNEYPLVRFLERNGYDTSYIAGVDTDRYGSLLTNHKTFLSVGHDEYWSGAQRANVEKARDAGVNLMFLSGNEVYWRTRYEPSIDGTSTSYRTLVCYKETWAGTKTDPSSESTATWRDPTFASTANGGGLPENRLTGTLYQSNFTDLAIQVPAAMGKQRMWRGTSVANQSPGQTATLAPHTVGYESDEDRDNGSRPPGLIRTSQTTGPTDQLLTDFGNTVVKGTTTHSTTLYRAPSGALVFGAGTVQWTWGLDSTHDSDDATNAPADPRMQQAQVNLLADMGAQPASLQSDLVPATASTDSTGPSVTITSPTSATAVTNGDKVTLTGTATDAATGGGVVAGVEVSTDGSTWHPATGTSSWTYSYVQHDTGTSTVRVRGIDDSANTGTPSTVALRVSCPCSVFGSAVPDQPSVSDTSGVELGLRFTPTTDGFIDGVRFYKGSANTGTHVGTLWTAAGAKLASVTFTGETATGWQSAAFATSVPVSAGTTYVVSYTAPQGGYAASPYALAYRGLDASPLTIGGGFGATPAGTYASPGMFPTQSYRATAYGVDVSFTTLAEAPLTATAQSPLPGSTSVPPTSKITARFQKDLTPGSQGLVLRDASGSSVAGSTSYDSASRTIVFTPAQPLDQGVTFTVTLSGSDAQGHQVSTGSTWSFTTTKPAAPVGVCPCTLYDDGTQPAVLDTTETRPVTLGTTFSATKDGTVSGLRFYKAPGNTGSHVGTLWGSDGSVLARGTFTGESTSGWQTLTFPSPVQVTRGTKYTVGYRSTTGSYSVTPDGFGSLNPSRGPLVVGPSAGVYSYADSPPTSTTSASYLVDPVFSPLPPSISVVAQDPPAGSTDVPRRTSVRVWFDNPVTSGASLTVSVGGNPVVGATSLSSDGTRLTFDPSATLPAGATVSVQLSGVVSTDGAALPSRSWSFTTSSTDPGTQQSLFSNQLPATAAVDESSPVELGTRFTPSRDGQVSALRFFKGAGNGGTHIGTLWSDSGAKLASVTFTGESPSGWQTAKLSTPVDVTGGTSYVVSYLAPQGHYSTTPHLFDAALVNGDLTGPGGANGRYLYGTAGGFPTYSYGSTAYFVDVVYVPTPRPLRVVSQSPAAGTSSADLTSKPSVIFNSPLAAGWSVSASSGGSAVPGSAALSADGTTLTFTPSTPLPADRDVTVSASGLVSTEGSTLPGVTWTFHTVTAATTTTTLFGTLTPATSSANDSSGVELGVSFTPSSAGSATGVRFYKGSGNGGTHTGTLWAAGGTRLASVTFTGETSSGWQQASFSSPVALTAGTTYVVSYYAPQGHYAVTGGFFSRPWVSGPLTAPATGNGRYRYGSGGVMPTGTYNGGNYFVDVLFRQPN